MASPMHGRECGQSLFITRDAKFGSTYPIITISDNVFIVHCPKWLLHV